MPVATPLPRRQLGADKDTYVALSPFLPGLLPGPPALATTDIAPFVTNLATTTTKTPAWTWATRNPFVLTTTAPAPSAKSTVLGTSFTPDQPQSPVIVTYGLLNTMLFCLCLMLVPSFFVWCCMRRSRVRVQKT